MSKKFQKYDPFSYFFSEQNDDDIPELEEASKDVKEWLTTTFANSYQVIQILISELFMVIFLAFKSWIGKTRTKISGKCNQNRIIY